MARPKKPITLYKEALVNLSYREKLKEYLRLYFTEYDETTDEKLYSLEHSFSTEEKVLFNDYYEEIFRCLLTERYRLLSIISTVDNYCFYINSILREIDEYEQTVVFLNTILARIKDKAEEESPEEKQNASSYSAIEKQLRTYYSVSDGIRIENKNYYLNVDCSPYLKEINKAVDSLTRTLKVAKGFSVALQEFADTYKINDLIPKELRDFENMYKKDLASAWWNSSRVYKEYTSKENKTKEDEDTINTIKESKLFPNLFPDYNDVEPAADMIGKNNFLINKCATKPII